MQRITTSQLYLRIENISVDRLVVVMLMTSFVQADECLLEDLINRCLPSPCWAHTHQPMAHQLSLIQLNNFSNLDR